MNEAKESHFKKKVWYFGREVQDFCPRCESPMPFFPTCYRCGYRVEDGETNNSNCDKEV
jgi:hypothetical protein